MIRCERDDIALFKHMRMHAVLKFPSDDFSYFNYFYIYIYMYMHEQLHLTLWIKILPLVSWFGFIEPRVGNMANDGSGV